MKTILLIEDDCDILENLGEFLELQGYHILSAKDGQVGVELAQNKNFDLIICDVMMPKLNGIQVFLILKEELRLKKIPFVFSTAMSEKTDMNEALEMGVDAYLIKPFDFDILIKKIKYFLRENLI